MTVTMQFQFLSPSYLLRNRIIQKLVRFMKDSNLQKPADLGHNWEYIVRWALGEHLRFRTSTNLISSGCLPTRSRTRWSIDVNCGNLFCRKKWHFQLNSLLKLSYRAGCQNPSACASGKTGGEHSLCPALSNKVLGKQCLDENEKGENGDWIPAGLC